MTLGETLAITDVLTESNLAMINAQSVMKLASKRIDELETALNRMILAHENCESDSEGHYPSPDSGCIECTCGTVPDKYNTGLCAYHNAKKLLRQV